MSSTRARHRIDAAVAALMLSILAAGAPRPPVAEAAVDAGFVITDATVADQDGVPTVAAQLAGVLLGTGVQLSGTASINGGTAFSDATAGIRAFGTFTGGTADVGIPSGLVIGANARASTFAIGDYQDSIDADRDDDGLAELLVAAGLCSAGNLSGCVNNATSLEFSVVPTDRYLKFEYVLGITESGSWNGSSWSGEVFDFPDGFGLFVGGLSTSDNCAVIPTTSTYVSMNTAGVVAPAGDRAVNRAVALQNLSDLISDPASAPTPPGLAYAAEDGDWTVRFLTVPLTCVVDLGAVLPTNVPIKIVVADANDELIPPVVFLAGGSVRFSSSDTPSSDDGGGGGTPPPPGSPEPSAPTPSPIPDPGGDLPTSTAPGSSSGSVSGVPSTPTPSVPTSGTASYQVGTVQAQIQVGGAGTVSGPSGAPVIQVVRDRVGTVGGGGMAPGGIVEVWMPLPGGGSRQVALLPVGADGTFNGALPFTGELDGGGPLPIGERTIQLFGTDANGQLTVINVGIRVQQPGPLAPEPERAPGAPPTLTPGRSLATNAGLPTSVTVTPLVDSRTARIAGDGWLLDIAVPEGTLRDEAGNPIFEIVLGDRTAVAGTGFLPGTRAYVWLMSTPRFLGEVTIRPDGTFAGSLPVTGVAAGPHTLQVAGVGTDGYIRAANLGVIVTSDGRRPTAVRAGEGTDGLLPLQLTGLLAAGLAGLVAATRTRRRST